MPARKGDGIGLTADIDHRVGRVDAGGHGVLDEQQSALRRIAVRIDLVDLDHAELDCLALVWPGDRRILDLVSRLRELDLQLHAHRAVANTLADFVDEIVGAGSRELVLGQILGIAFRLHLIAHKGAVALGVGEPKAVRAKIGKRGKAHRRRLFRRQESLGYGMRFEELLKGRGLRRIFSARSERYQELPELCPRSRLESRYTSALPV